MLVPGSRSPTDTLAPGHAQPWISSPVLLLAVGSHSPTRLFTHKFPHAWVALTSGSSCPWTTLTQGLPCRWVPSSVDDTHPWVTLAHMSPCPWAPLPVGHTHQWISSLLGPMVPLPMVRLAVGCACPWNRSIHGSRQLLVPSPTGPLIHGFSCVWVTATTPAVRGPHSPTHGSAVARAMARGAGWYLLLPLTLLPTFPTGDANPLQVLEVAVTATVPSGQRFPRTTLGAPVSFDCPVAVRQCPPGCPPPATSAVLSLRADAFLAGGVLFPLTLLSRRRFAWSVAALPNSQPGLCRCFSAGLAGSWAEGGLIRALLLESDVVSLKTPSPEGVLGSGYRHGRFTIAR